MKTSTITKEEARKIANSLEGHFTDIKAIDITPGKLTRTMAAFANADGGEIFIGVDEDKSNGNRSWRGFTRHEDANGHIQIFEKLFPFGTDFDYLFLECSGWNGYVLRVDIRKTKD